MKEEQWAFKAIFQKAMIRLGKIVEFEYKGKDKNLGTIDDVLDFLNKLYDQDILKVYALLPQHPFSLWTFIAVNPGNNKIKVAKAVEDRIFAILCLWYFGERKIQINIQENNKILSPRQLLKFFAAETNKIQWPNCSNYYQTIYKGFDTNAFYGADHDQLSDEKKKDMVRERFSALLAQGISNLKTHDELSEEIDN